VASVVNDVSRATPAESALSGRGLVHAAGWMTGSHLLAQGFAYGSLILLARWLTPTSFGTIAVGTGIVYVAVLFVDQGIIGGIVVRPRLTRTDLIRAFWRSLLTACGLAAVMAGAAGFVVTHFASGGDVAALAALALCLPLHAFAVVPTALLQRSMQFRRIAGVNAGANVVSAVVAVLMAVAGFGVWALVARQLVLFVVQAVLTPALCIGALRIHTSAVPNEAAARVPSSERWFLLCGVALLVTTNLDNLVVGGFGDAYLVGLYALAFTIAMAPSTHISDQVGRVLFAAAALQPDNSRERTEQSVRLMSMLFVPMVPVGILLAPTVLPAVLGDQWRPIVVPFQLLLVVGVGHAVVNCIGEALSGNGHIEFRAWTMVVRGVATLVALLILVPLDGIRGAALAQLAVFVLWAAVYATAGARRADTSPSALARQLRPVALAVAAQVAASTAVYAALIPLAVSELAVSCAAAAAGLAVCVPVMYWLGIRGQYR
jgi:O-antigen/teichoic acid export membrane protein